MANTVRDDSYDVGLFDGVVQADTTCVECFAGMGTTYYYKKPVGRFADTTVYTLVLTNGVALPRQIPIDSVIYEDLACTKPVPVGKVILTHFGAK